MRIIRLSDDGQFGVYAAGRKGPYGTSLMFKGTLEECLNYRRGVR